MRVPSAAAAVLLLCCGRCEGALGWAPPCGNTSARRECEAARGSAAVAGWCDYTAHCAHETADCLAQVGNDTQSARRELCSTALSSCHGANWRRVRRSLYDYLGENAYVHCFHLVSEVYSSLSAACSADANEVSNGLPEGCDARSVCTKVQTIGEHEQPSVVQVQLVVRAGVNSAIGQDWYGKVPAAAVMATTGRVLQDRYLKAGPKQIAGDHHSGGSYCPSMTRFEAVDLNGELSAAQQLAGSMCGLGSGDDSGYPVHARQRQHDAALAAHAICPTWQSSVPGLVDGLAEREAGLLRRLRLNGTDPASLAEKWEREIRPSRYGGDLGSSPWLNVSEADWSKLSQLVHQIELAKFRYANSKGMTAHVLQTQMYKRAEEAAMALHSAAKCGGHRCEPSMHARGSGSVEHWHQTERHGQDSFGYSWDPLHAEVHAAQQGWHRLVVHTVQRESLSGLLHSFDPHVEIHSVPAVPAPGSFLAFELAYSGPQPRSPVNAGRGGRFTVTTVYYPAATEMQCRARLTEETCRYASDYAHDGTGGLDPVCRWSGGVCTGDTAGAPQVLPTLCGSTCELVSFRDRLRSLLQESQPELLHAPVDVLSERHFCVECGNTGTDFCMERELEIRKLDGDNDEEIGTVSLVLILVMCCVACLVACVLEAVCSNRRKRDSGNDQSDGDDLQMEAVGPAQIGGGGGGGELATGHDL